MTADWLSLSLPDTIDYYREVRSAKGSDDALKIAERKLVLGDLYYIMVHIFKRKDFLHPWLFDRCREVQANPDGYLDLWSRDHRKDLADDTPMFTANRGWTTHGELEIGDEVYSPSGAPTKIVGLSGRFKDSDCYKVTMKDGAEIVCGKQHLWRIRKKSKNRIGNWRLNERVTNFTDIIISTEELHAMAIAGKRIDLGAADPLQMPKSALPIDPYVFGCWLGDGHSDSARFTTSKNDWPHFRNEFLRSGHRISVSEERENCLVVTFDQYDKKRFCARGHDKEIGGTYKLQCIECRKLWNGKKAPPQTQDGMPYRLRTLGLLKGAKKFIPDVYMRASVEQRMELLRGLMDTDGGIGISGTATFTNINKNLAEQCYELATCLGFKPRFRTYKAKLNGRIISDCYTVSMQAHKNKPVFKLGRKLIRSLERSKYVDSRYVKYVERTESVPTRCIQIANEDGLYLAGRTLIPTHNSTTITYGLTIQEVLKNPEITIGLFSHVKPISKAFLNQIKQELQYNVHLKYLFDDILYADPENESPSWSLDNGIVVKRTTNPKEPTILACGLVEGMPTGMHFQLRVYDDVVTASSVSTPEQMQKTLDALDLSDNLGTQGGRVRMIGTRYKQGDAYEEYIKRGIVKPRIYPATDDGTIDGVPVFLTDEEWEDKLQRQSPAIIASQMLQNPLASDSVIFQPDWFRLWPSDKELPPFDAVFLSIDGAFSEKETADDSCLLMLGLFKATEGSAKYSVMVLDCYMDRMAYPDLRDEILRQYMNKYGANDKIVDALIIEDKASGSALIPDLQRAGVGVYPFHPGRLDKVARANLISHLIRDGYVWLPESRNTMRKGKVMSWLSKWHEQVLYFPNVKHEDGVDALVQALIMLDQRGFLRGRVAEQREPEYYRSTSVGSYSG